MTKERLMRALSSLLAVCLLFVASAAEAAVKPHALFTEHMVLQQGRDVFVWGMADPGERVTVRIQNQEVAATAGADGKWQVRLKPLMPGGPFELTIAGTNSITLKDVLVGEVWIASGQSNMQWPVNRSADPEKTIAESAHPQIRLFTVPRIATKDPQDNVDAAWQVCGPDTTPEFSAVAYFFGRALQDKLKVPVGLINTSYGGTPAEAWTTRQKMVATPDLQAMVTADDQAMAAYPEAQKKYEEELKAWEAAAKAAKDAGQKEPAKPQPPVGPGHPHRPCGLYNAMIHPLLPYAIRGAIWYQGESNAGRAYQYRTLFPAMITSWREAWGQDEFPFLFVQLAPFMKIVDQPGDSAWAELREAQLLTTTNTPNTAMAVITDVGDEADIHPQKKQPVGERLALAARALAYGEKIEHSGPTFDQQKVDGGKIVLSFKHVGDGLEAKDGALKGFAIAGSDMVFKNAQAEIQGETVIVSSPEVTQPVAVRYGWANFPLGNLWNKNGLPASPFRTDDFPLTTKPK
jgi:sialate O-acetylesterase